jgi:hypothetical protein
VGRAGAALDETLWVKPPSRIAARPDDALSYACGVPECETELYLPCKLLWNYGLSETV